MLRDAALLQLDLARRALAADLALKDASAVQRAVARQPAGVHRRRLVRAAAAGRAVGRLPPVLHAVPVPADAAGLQGPAVPRACCAARSTASRRTTPAPCSPRRATASGGRVLERAPARAARGALRRRRRDARSSGAAARRVQQGDPRREPRQAEKLVRRLRWAAGRRPGRATATHNTYDDEAARRKAAFVREAAAPAARRSGVGRRLQRWHVLARRGRARRARGRRSTPITRRSTLSTARCRTRAHGHPAARRRRHRPVAGPRLARARARVAGAARHARPDLVPRARPPRRHHRPTCPCASSSPGCGRSTARWSSSSRTAPTRWCSAC